MRYILIVLWLFLGLGYYLIARSCGKEMDPIASIEDTTIVDSGLKKEIPCPRIGPFAFNQGSADLIKTNHWDTFKDSLLLLLVENKKIQIVGLTIEGESKLGDLGKQRAHSLASAMGMKEENLQIYESNLGKKNYHSDCQIPGARIKLVRVTEKIKEIQDRTLIYFPYNSTNKLNDEEVESYLDGLALKVIESNQQIRLTGHTDNKGEPDYNLKLGQSRAEVIKNYLVSKLVPIDNIIAVSKGEKEPIADNDNEEGRAQNRRTELEIIN